MTYRGDIRLGDTLDFHFTTRQISGAPFTLAGTPVISAYPSNSVTQLTAGITLDVDFDSVTGLNHVRVVASGGNGYATATDYSLVITTGTVNGVSVVGEVIGGFSIEHRSALMPATAARTLVVDAAGLADANMVKMGPTGSGTAQTARDIGTSVLLSSGTGTGQISLSSGKVAEVVLVDTLTTYTGNTPQTGDPYARIGAAGAGLTALGDTRIANLDAAVSSRSTYAGADTSGTTTLLGRLTATRAGLLDNLDAAVSSRMATYTQPTGFLVTTFPLAVGDATAANQSTINGNVLAAPGVVWDITLSSHLASGSTGAALNAAGSSGDPWNTALPGAYGAGSAGFIVGTNLNATVSSRLAAAGYTAPDNSGIAAIKAQTDQFTFAVPGYASVNIAYVAGTKVNGSGTANSPWGP